MPTKTELDARVRALKQPIKPLTDWVIEYARTKRDGERDRAGRLIRSAEKEERALTATEQQQVDRAIEGSERWSARYDATKRDAQAAAERPWFVREPMIYERASPYSFFADLLSAKDDPEAKQRLDHHARQMRFHVNAINRAQKKDAQAPDGTEYREVPTVADDGSLTPPAYLVEQLALVPRPVRVLADRVTNLRLAAGVSAIRVPRVATSTANTGVQVEGATVTSSGIEDEEITADNDRWTS
jgi:hypothetical protein